MPARLISPQLLSRLGPVLGLIAVYGLFAAIGPPGFSSARNLETIARQTAIVGTAALGMTLVIISGGIDLSVGSLVAFTGGLGIWVMNTVIRAPAILDAAQAQQAGLTVTQASYQSGLGHGILISVTLI